MEHAVVGQPTMVEMKRNVPRNGSRERFVPWDDFRERCWPTRQGVSEVGRALSNGAGKIAGVIAVLCFAEQRGVFLQEVLYLLILALYFF